MNACCLRAVPLLLALMLGVATAGLFLSVGPAAFVID